MSKKLIFPKGSFESKMYCVTCIIACVFCFSAFIVNFFVGIGATFNLFVFGVGLFFVYFYFKAIRFGVDLYHLLSYLFLSFMLVSVSWFVNEGASGSMTVLMVLFLIQAVIITKVKYVVYVVLGMVSLLATLVFLEYSFPEWLTNYESDSVRKVDVLITLFMVLLAASYFMYQIKKAYQLESDKLKEGLAIYRRAKLESEKYVKLQSEFIANVSHEIRTPLNGIIGNAELLSELNKTPDSEDFVKNISSSGQLLLSMINNILDLSKIESDKLELSLRPFSLNELITQVKSVFKLEVEKKGLVLIFSVSRSLPDVLIGDQSRIKQVLINLIGNAVKFTEKGGVEVKLAGVVYENELNLKVSVKDTGIGIAEDDQKNLFDRFFQVNHSLSKNHDGVGLGLIITKNLVQIMGGDIKVKSVIGKGTVFRFNLLLRVETNKPVSRDELASKVNTNLKVLIAEDNEINAMLLERQLLGFGLKAKITENGIEVLNELKKESYDIIFMDVQMPEMDGIEATIRIRANDKIKPPIIIALTANANVDHRERCLDVGMNDYLTKPTSNKDILAMIKKWTV